MKIKIDIVDDMYCLQNVLIRLGISKYAARLLIKLIL